MITLKQYDDLRKEVQRASLTCKAPGYGITLGLTVALWQDLQSVVDRIERKDSVEYYFYNVPIRLIDGDGRIERKDSVEYYFYNVPIRLIDGDGRIWMLYFAKGDIR